jgi:hypothetical protein
MTHREAACEIPAVRPAHKAFVAVYPPLPDKGVDQWRVRRFELPIELLDEYFGEEDLVDSLFYKLQNIEEVEGVLADWGVNPAQLDAPWKCEYPL